MHPKAYKLRRIAFSVATLLSAAPACAIDGAQVTRLTPERIEVSWTDGDPVDLYVSAAPDAEPGEWRLVESEDRDGHFEFGSSRKERVYFLLRDRGDQSTLKVAERELPLEHSSNFRDLGGYPAADGRHVRWGRVYRSGASALLSDADVDAVDHLGVTALVDLRSTEERSLAPTRLTGIPYRATDYSMRPLVAQLSDPQLSRPVIMERLYREWPLSLAAQFREVFEQLLASPGPVLYNCSAGQDRTGVATALVLSALGVPRQVVLEDYLLSTQLRRPENELPHIDPTEHADDPVALFFARSQDQPGARKPQPLVDAQGRPWLAATFAEIELRWGSVEGYLDQVLGVDAADIETLRKRYLE